MTPPPAGFSRTAPVSPSPVTSLHAPPSGAWTYTPLTHEPPLPMPSNPSSSWLSSHPTRSCRVSLPPPGRKDCLLVTPFPSAGCSGTHPHMLVLRHSTGPRPRGQGGTRFLGTPAGHSRSCIRSGRWLPQRSHCPASCHSAVPARSCTAWRWFEAPLQGTRALRGRPLPSRNWPRNGHTRNRTEMVWRGPSEVLGTFL